MTKAHFLWRAWRVVLGAGVLALAACGRSEMAQSPLPSASSATSTSVPERARAAANESSVTRYGYEVIRAWPHDSGAFTQGLVLRNGGWVESTGLVGRSSLRTVDMASGRVVKQTVVPPPYFGEGLAVLGGRAYVLTWQHHKGFVYDVDTFRLEREFTYAGEGWGLATDGRLLILSDGTARIRFLDSADFSVVRTIDITLNGRPVAQLNELEFIRGEIFANVWLTDQVVRIDPATGQVRGVIDFTGLLPAAERGPEADVLNGIAYDAAEDRLFITGKCWPKIFEVRLKPAK